MNNEQKPKSISTIEWISHASVLVAGGVQHDIQVYNTHVSERIYSIKGHNDPITQIKWLEDTYELFSSDVSGLVKVWDYRNWHCLQTF